MAEISTVETWSKRGPDVVYKKTAGKNAVQRFFKRNLEFQKILLKNYWTTFFQGVFLWITFGSRLDHVAAAEISPKFWTTFFQGNLF